LNALNLYSLIEADLDFSDEIEQLYTVYLDIVDELKISSLIDIGCGQGDFLIEIKKLNIPYFGVDLSSSQIEICQTKGLNTECLDISLIQDKYHCATAIFDVLNYLSENKIKTFISSTYELLHNDGYFIFDINSLFGFQEVAQGSLNINKENKFISIDAYFENNKLQTHINLFEKNKDNLYSKKSDTLVQYYHSKDRLIKILKKYGFDIKQIINFHLHSEEKEDKFIFICQKIYKNNL